MKINDQTTTFSYDANGQRVMTRRPDQTILYTPFPDYEREVPQSGPVIERVTYRLAGQIVAVRAAALNYVYTDHLGNVVGFGGLGGGFTAASLARYDPFGNFRTTPTTNPGTTARGFTGHMHNNTGTTSLGLIYMNARYYLPEIWRFVSADSIVPEPENPQSYNRYSYVRNSPVNLIDPSGHRECRNFNATSCTTLASRRTHASPGTPRIREQLTSFEPIFEGLPLPLDDIKWANGFGANNYAASRANPLSASYELGKYKGSGGLHGGIDLGASAGTNVYANVSGILLDPSPFPGDAEPNVMVQLPNGMIVVYGHVVKLDGLAADSAITPGMLIGTVDNRGEDSHVHLSLREGTAEGQRTYNPAYFFADPSLVVTLPYSEYAEGESLFSITSFLYQPSGRTPTYGNYWTYGEASVGVWR